MGQHKTNPVAKAAKEGKIPPKPKKKGKAELDRELRAKVQEILYKPLIEAYEKLQEEDPFK